MEKKKLVITGASGFIGKDFLHKIDFDLFEVTVVTRDAKKVEGLFDPRVKIKIANLLDTVSLIQVFEGQDILVNLAAEVRNIAILEKTNIDGTINLIEAIKSSSIKQVVHLSSVGVQGIGYRNNAILIDEETYSPPQNEYERTKLISEQLFLEASKNIGFELLVVRPTNVFGENHPFNALLNLMNTISNGKVLLTTKSAVVNYVYVGDLNAFVYSSIRQQFVTGIYNVGSSLKLKEFYILLKSKLNPKSKIIFVPNILVKFTLLLGIKKLQAISNRATYSDKKLTSIFHYPDGIESGIEKTINHFKKRNLLK